MADDAYSAIPDRSSIPDRAETTRQSEMPQPFEVQHCETPDQSKVLQQSEMVDALDDMVIALQATCHASQTAAEEATELRERSRTGTPLHEALKRNEGPALVQRISALQRRLSQAASRLRRVQARRLHGEGLTTEHIATIFGVSRQRISAILRDTEAG
jgi:hypothetical protein